MFNPEDPAFLADPHPILKRIRKDSPILFWPPARGYIFFRHHDMATLLKDPRLVTDPTFGAGFSAEQRAKYPAYTMLRENDMFMVSPSAHARIRKLINPVFSPRSIDEHRPAIAAILAEILDELPLEGTINASEQFARRYPVRVIAAILGVPREREADFIALANALIATIFPGVPREVFESFMPALERGLQVVLDLIAARRDDPRGTDLFSQLLHARDTDDRLSEGELVSLVAGILVGGSDTTVHLTTYALQALLQHPDQLALLRADPGLMRSALDETLRFNNFARGPGIVRFAQEDFEYEGLPIKRGQPLFFNRLSAFRDEEFLADADVYDIRRRINASPWFGYGPHFCLGASLARVEAEMAMQAFLDRYPRIELTGPVTYGTHPFLRDIVDLPLLVGQDPATAAA